MVFIATAILIVLIYVIKILNEVRGFFKAIRSGTDALSEDLSEVRTKLRDKGVMTGFMLSLITAVVGFGQKAKERRAQKKSK